MIDWRKMEWRILSAEEILEQERLDELYMPPEVFRYRCPYCGAHPRMCCLTRDGEWAGSSHAKRLALISDRQAEQLLTGQEP